MRVYIVIRTYNEAENLIDLVSYILRVHPDFNIMIVDDNSPDGTGEIADKLAASDPRIHVVHRPERGAVSVRRMSLVLKRPSAGEQT